jgi:hypothetical protein
MSTWNDKALIIMRDAIGDAIKPYTYDDTRLSSIILTAGYLNSLDIDFTYDYTVNLLTGDISPLPTDDDNFIALMVLRAISILAESEWKTESRKGVIVRDGPTSIDMTAMVEAKAAYAKEMRDRFSRAVTSYRCGNYATGLAIVGPARFDLAWYTQASPRGGNRFY